MSALFAWWSLTQLHLLITIVVCTFQLVVYWRAAQLPDVIINVGNVTIGWVCALEFETTFSRTRVIFAIYAPLSFSVAMLATQSQLYINALHLTDFLS